MFTLFHNNWNRNFSRNEIRRKKTNFDPIVSGEAYPAQFYPHLELKSDSYCYRLRNIFGKMKKETTNANENN